MAIFSLPLCSNKVRADRLSCVAITAAMILSAPVQAEEHNNGSQTLPPVSVFSSFLSDEQTNQCKNAHVCVEDFVSADVFFNAIKQKSQFMQLAASENGFDYEILIANAFTASGTDLEQGNLGGVNSHMITEIDIVWRGIPLSSYQFSIDDLSQTIGIEHKQKLADKTIQSLLDKSINDNVFSAEFLFDKLNASNYQKDLKLPSTINAFNLEDMQLYRDPLQGAVARYTHPDYEREVLDVFVYPIFSPEPLKTESDLDADSLTLSNELSKDIDDIQLVAKARNIGEVAISDIKRIDWHAEQRVFSGYYFGVEAQDDQGEPLYTTTYLFQSKDKFIKFSANFPDRIAKEMVKNALPQIEVPEASMLMQSLRTPQS